MEKMMMCNKAEQGGPLQAEQADWLEDTDEEIDEQELEAHYSYMIGTTILFIVDSGCTKHMTGNLKLLCNFMEKFLGTVRFGNDQFAPILGYGDLIQGNVTIKRVYYVEGLNHNLFSVGQFCDADLEVAFRKSTCFVRDLQGNDLLTGSCGSDLYIISLQETTSSTPICFMAKASPTQACKAKRSSFKSKAVPSSRGRLNLLHMDLCGPMRVASINGKKYILVIVDDYSRYTWTLFLRSKDETPEVLKDFLTMIQRNLQAQVITNGVVERRNRTLVEAARTMLSASKLPLSFWAEAVATAMIYSDTEKTDSSQQGLEFLFSPLLEEYYNPTHGLAEENNNDQAPNASFQEAEFINPFCTWTRTLVSLPHNIDNNDVLHFNHKVQDSDGQRSSLEQSSWKSKTMQFNQGRHACHRS
ncbi:retrovirus-related pol polyprotein from transposon TNT 1-94 [Tanacetum coccineum]